MRRTKVITDLNRLPDDALLTPKELARRLNVHISTVFRWLNKCVRGRKLSSVLVGGQRRIRVSAVHAFFIESEATGGDHQSDGSVGTTVRVTAADAERIEQELDLLGIVGRTHRQSEAREDSR